MMNYVILILARFLLKIKSCFVFHKIILNLLFPFPAAETTTVAVFPVIRGDDTCLPGNNFCTESSFKVLKTRNY